MSEMMIWTTLAIVRMVRITGVEISKKPNVQNKQQFRTVSKRCKCDIHSVRNVEKYDLNNVHHS